MIKVARPGFPISFGSWPYNERTVDLTLWAFEAFCSITNKQLIYFQRHR
jgi:hypothetical protein